MLMLRKSFFLFAVLFLAGGLVFGQDARVEVSAEAGSGFADADFVFSDEDIARSGASSLAELLADVPFLQVSQGTGGFGSVVISARGSSGDNPFSQVQVRVDGVVQNNPDMTPPSLIAVPLSNIREVRVYDGGSGSRFGNGAIGAVIDIITRQETEPYFSVRGSYGTSNTWDAAVSGGYAEDRWGLGAFFSSAGTEGIRPNAWGLNFAGGVNGRVDFTDTLQGSLDVRAGSVAAGNPGSIYEGDSRDTSYNLEDEYVAQEVSAAAALGYEQGNLRVSAPLNVMYKRRLFDYVSNLDYGSDPSTTYWFVQPSFNPRVEYRLGRHSLEGGFDSRYTYYVGQSFFDLDRSSLDFDYTMQQAAFSPYIGYRFDAASWFSLIAGARYDVTGFWARKDEAGVDASDVYHNGAVDLTLEFAPVSHNKAYITAGTVYRVPFLDEKAALTGWGDGVNFDLESEKGVQAEIGWKGSVPQAHLRYSVSGFLLYMWDEIAYVYNALTFSGMNENYERTRRLGATAMLSYDPFAWLGADIGFTYVDGRFDEGEYEGNLIPNLSPWKFTAAIRSDIDRIGLFLKVYLNLYGRKYLASDKANEGDMTPVLPLLGVQASWRVPGLGDDKALTVNGSVDNILNVDYDDYAMYSSGYVYRYPAAGVNAKVWVSFSW